MNIAIASGDVAGIGHNATNFRDPLDVEIDDGLKPFRDLFDTRKGEIDRVKVSDDDEAGRATALAGILATIITDADAKRVEIKKPYLDGARKIDGNFGGFLETVKQAKAKVLALIDGYRTEQQRKAREEQARLAREAAEKEAAAHAAAEEGNALAAARLESQARAASAQAQTVAETPHVIRSAYGQTASGRKVWLHQITDRSKLPLIIVTHPKVLEAIDEVIASMLRTGTRELPGVRIWSEEKTVVRGR